MEGNNRVTGKQGMGEICRIPAPGADRSERRVARDGMISALSLWVSEPSGSLTTVRSYCRPWGLMGLNGLRQPVEALLGMRHGKGCEGWAQTPINPGVSRVR